MADTDDRYAELDSDIQDSFMETISSKSFPFEIGFEFISDDKLKQMVKIEKLQDKHKFLLKKEILVIVNETLYDKLEDDIIGILFEQEIDKISIKAETGKISMTKPDLVTYTPLIEKHGIEKIMRANNIDSLSSSQNDDMTSNFN